MPPAPQRGHNELGFNGPAGTRGVDSYGEAAGITEDRGHGHSCRNRGLGMSDGCRKRLDGYVGVCAFRFALGTVTLAAICARRI